MSSTLNRARLIVNPSSALRFGLKYDRTCLIRWVIFDISTSRGGSSPRHSSQPGTPPNIARPPTTCEPVRVGGRYAASRAGRLQRSLPHGHPARRLGFGLVGRRLVRRRSPSSRSRSVLAAWHGSLGPDRWPSPTVLDRCRSTKARARRAVRGQPRRPRRDLFGGEVLAATLAHWRKLNAVDWASTAGAEAVPASTPDRTPVILRT